MHHSLIFNLVAAFCWIAIFLAFNRGYSKRDRQLSKERKAFYKEMEKRVPKAIR